MMTIFALIGAVIVLLGSIVMLIAALGLLRMPDMYTRMQAGTKATTLGTVLIVMGLSFVIPAAWPKLVLLGIFVFLTNPVSSHVLTRSAHFQGVNPLDLKVKGKKINGSDALAEKESVGSGEKK